MTLGIFIFTKNVLNLIVRDPPQLIAHIPNEGKRCSTKVPSIKLATTPAQVCAAAVKHFSGLLEAKPISFVDYVTQHRDSFTPVPVNGHLFQQLLDACVDNRLV